MSQGLEEVGNEGKPLLPSYFFEHPFYIRYVTALWNHWKVRHNSPPTDRSQLAAGKSAVPRRGLSISIFNLPAAGD
jgi:hypothetical protein